MFLFSEQPGFSALAFFSSSEEERSVRERAFLSLVSVVRIGSFVETSVGVLGAISRFAALFLERGSISGVIFFEEERFCGFVEVEF